MLVKSSDVIENRGVHVDNSAWMRMMMCMCVLVVALFVAVAAVNESVKSAGAMPRWERLLNTDQPGRILAVFVFAPTLFYKSIVYKDKFIRRFAELLFIWDLYWLLLVPARVAAVKT
jgi:hypothetical protein